MRGVAHDPAFRAKLMALHQQGVSLHQLSQQFHLARPVLSRWWARYRDGDWEALQPYSRRPDRSPTRIAPALEQQILRLRQRGWGPARIAPQLGLGHGTVQRILTRFGQNRLPRPVRPRPQRYEKQRPGELLHLDVKFLPALRNARYDYEFAAVDDFSREAVIWITTEQTTRTATQFLERVLDRLPYRVEAIMTDNAWCTLCSMPSIAIVRPVSNNSVTPSASNTACSGLTLRNATVKSNASFAPSTTNA